MTRGKSFVQQAQEIFSFLTEYGFQLVSAEESSFPREEDVLVYRKGGKLKLVIYHDPCRHYVWSTAGKPRARDAWYTVGLHNLLTKIGVSRQETNDDENSIERAREEALLWKTYFLSILQGDLRLLEEIWVERLETEAKQLELQRRSVIKREVIGRAEVLELPNTPEVLGSHYQEKTPNHNIPGDTVWMVVAPGRKFICFDHNVALDAAKECQ